jgi:hypothetical protein
MDEILVHVSAPTTHKSDDTYRFLARAYADFEPYNPDEDRGHNLTIVKNAPANSSKRGSFEDAHVVLAASKESFGSFPSCIPSGDDCNVPSFSAASLESFQNSVVDSSRLAQLERIQLHWKRKTGVKSSFPPASSANIPSAGDPGATFIEDSQLAAQALQSQLFDRGSTTSEATSDEEGEGLEPESRSETGLSLQRPSDNRRSPSDQTTHVEAATSSILPDKKQPAVRVDERHNILDYPRTLPRRSPVTPSKPLKAAPLQERFRSTHPPSLDFSQLPTEVFPPAPKISIRCPNALPSQTTAYLKGLKHDYVDRFKPAVRSRTLKADERGFWLIDTVNWSQKEQYDFWSVLCEHIRLGDFGWGVSLFREPPSSGKIVLGSNARLGQVRLYCWGEVVEEAWLALWTCSRGNIAGSGTRWLDAEDATVIQVP